MVNLALALAMIALAAEQVHVVDGDTIDAAGARWRLLGFDTPETKFAKCARERVLGTLATNRLKAVIAGARRIEIAPRKGRDVHNRRLGALLIDGNDVAGLLIGEGLARPYNAGVARAGASQRSSYKSVRLRMSPDMCNLYSLHRNRDVIGRLLRVAHNRMVACEPQAAIFPGYPAPVVRHAADGEGELVTMNWGFVLLQDGRAPRRVTNVRDDKILTSKFWRPSFEQRRCLVPASSYCEPKGEKPATWHWFALRGEEPRPLFAFPGVWTRYRGPLKKNGEPVDQEVFAFMTTEPNALTASINHERMPVIITDPADFDTWLSAPPAEAFGLARSYAAEQMRIVQSGSDREDLLVA